MSIVQSILSKDFVAAKSGIQQKLLQTLNTRFVEEKNKLVRTIEGK